MVEFIEEASRTENEPDRKAVEPCTMWANDMNSSYVENREAGYWVAGTRVSLDSIVYAFYAGQTAESIAQMFPMLTLEQVYGAVAYYLAHRAEIDKYLSTARSDFEALRQA